MIKDQTVNDASGTGTKEQFKFLLVQFAFYVLPEIACHFSFVGHHHLINTLHVCGWNEEALSAEHLKEGTNFEKMVRRPFTLLCIVI